MKFNPSLSWEFLSADEIAGKTLRALRNHVKHVKEVSPYYREAFWDFSPDEIKNLDDFHRLPFTGRTSLAEHTSRFVAAPAEAIVETVATAGATGKPIFCPLTANDRDRLAFSHALSFHSMGISPSDKVLLLVGIDRWSLAGIGFYEGLILLGANTGRAGVATHELCKQYLDSYKPTVLVGAPSYLRRLAIDITKTGYKVSESGVAKLVCAGESLQNQDLVMNALGKKLQDLWGAKAYVSYAITEIADSFSECVEQKGSHSHPELLYAEIIDENGHAVPDGRPGELVTTSFGVEGMPLVRYRTGDITIKVPGTCPCGRNSARIGPILGRVSETIRVKGMVVYPLTITNALDEMDDINDYVLILEGDDAHTDRVTIHVAAQPSVVERIAQHVRSVAQVNFPILISNISTIQSMRGTWRRSSRIIDWRQQAQRR